MTSLLNIAGNVPTDAFAEGSSLRFEDGDSAYLSFTPASAGNRKTWTWSGWIKPAAFGKAQPIFSAYTSSTNYTVLGFDLSGFIGGGDSLKLWGAISNSTSCALTTNAVFRDPSAWYHVLIETDTTQATAADRIKIYVNGEQVTSFSSSTYPAQNANAGIINAANLHQIGTLASGTYGKFDGYLANVTFIDGQALDPTSFGEYEDTLWKPKSDSAIQALTFGTNGFYLPMKQTTEAEGFSTVTYTGNGSTQGIEGVGFNPDFVWIKSRSFANNHHLFDTVRGAGEILRSSATDAESSLPVLSSFDNSGFTVKENGGNNATNDSGSTFVGWAWDAGADLAPTGFNAVTYTGSGDTQSISGLGFEPDLVWVKKRSGAEGHALYDSVRGTTNRLRSDASTAENTGGLTSFDSNGFTFNGSYGTDNESGFDYVAWAWDAGTGSAASNTDGSITSSVKADTTKGFSICTYTGNATDGATIGHGLSQTLDMVIVKDRTNSASWRVMHKDIDYANDTLYLDANYGETADDRVKAFSSTTFTVTGGGGVNGSARDHVAYCFHSVSGYSDIGSYTGNGSTTGPTVTTGFRPAFIMIKRTDVADNWIIYDTTRSPFNPADKGLFPNDSGAELTGNDIDFNSTGFQLKTSDNGFNASGGTYIYMTFAGGKDLSAPLNTDGSITSRVKANTTNGFSIITYTGNGTDNATIGHGLSQAPDMVITKNRDYARNWVVAHSAISGKGINLNETSAAWTDTAIYDTDTLGSSVLTVGDSNYINSSIYNYVMYAFHSVSGYSDFGSYTGTGAAGNSITGLGFKPAWLMYKRSDSTGNWIIHDNTRDVDDDQNKRLYPNLSNAEQTVSPHDVTFDSDGFTMNTTGGDGNASGGTYIYMAFKDTRDATFFGDTSGNSNNWTPNALNNTDVVPDSPVTNFATHLSSDSTAVTITEGSLEIYYSPTNWRSIRSTFEVSSGKWYWEVRAGGSTHNAIGVAKNWLTSASSTQYVGITADSYGYLIGGQLYNNASGSSYGDTYTTGDVIGVALDMDSGTLEFFKNNVSQGTAATSLSGSFTPVNSVRSANSLIANFGQDSSFAGNETPQGNTDDNGQGDFFYAPPSGFLALTRNNLPSPDILDPADYFNTVLYTGDGDNTRQVTGVGFQPDFTWIKRRNTTGYNVLFDAVRGATNWLYSNATDAEDSASYTNDADFISDGFKPDNAGSTNASGSTYASWNWLAGGTAVSNTDGSITSQVSANTDAGFSIATYSGNGTAGATIGHGLTASVPEMIIVKDRTATGFWAVYHSGNTSAPETDLLRLNTTNATLDGSVYWNDTAPTSSVFTVGTSSTVNNSSRDYVAYCFHSVEGYSKIGSYTGNGSTDGTFVHCGFRPAWVMVKDTTTAYNWMMHDSKRSPSNQADEWFYANLSNAEETQSTEGIDILSNGFKLKTTNVNWNKSSDKYIFIAFAEAPFRNANAR